SQRDRLLNVGGGHGPYICREIVLLTIDRGGASGDLTESRRLEVSLKFVDRICEHIEWLQLDGTHNEANPQTGVRLSSQVNVDGRGSVTGTLDAEPVRPLSKVGEGVVARRVGHDGADHSPA